MTEKAAGTFRLSLKHDGFWSDRRCAGVGCLSPLFAGRGQKFSEQRGEGAVTDRLRST